MKPACSPHCVCFSYVQEAKSLASSRNFFDEYAVSIIALDFLSWWSEAMNSVEQPTQWAFAMWWRSGQ